jgi:phosphonate transport system substrate-binding protein
MLPSVRGFLFLYSMLLSILVALPPADGAGLRVLGLGVISPKPEQRLIDYAPLARHLADSLRSSGIEQVKVHVPKDIEEMERLIRNGSVHIVLESALPTIQLEKAGMIPSLLAWRKGVREYRTLFFVRKDSPIQRLADLKGKTIAFQDPHSTSAFAIPVLELRNHGLQPAPADGARQKSEDALLYSFSGAARNEAYWVAQKKVDAGAFNNNDWDDLPPTVRSELRIIHETRPIIRYCVSLHRDLPASLRQALETVLINANKSRAGKHALSSASEIRKIERLGDAERASLEYLRPLLNPLN